MNRKKLALFILLIVFALAVVWSYMSVPRQKTVSKLKYAPGQPLPPAKPVTGSPVTAAGKAAPVSVAAVDERILRIDLLDQEQQGFKGYRRNIFKPIFLDDVKEMMRRAAAPKPLPLPPVTPPKVEPPPVVVPVDTHQAALARFVFLGYLKKDSRKTIFLSKDKDIILVRKGDRFAGKYEATSLTDQALTIIAIDSGEEIVIPLLENQPLAATVRRK